jgi:hypothetical protein
VANRAPYYRIVFGLAALYNLGFGLWAGFAPDSFFNLFDLPPPLYPALWRCIGMLVGTYALAYGYAVWRPERAAPLIAVGLVGKILGPVGWVVMVHSGEWSLRTFPLVLFNDIVWWLPFALFLLDGTKLGGRIRSVAPWACATLNALAAAALLVCLRPGTEMVTDPAARAAYIVAHPILWRGGWGLWIAAALSLLAFYAWWGSRLGAPVWGTAAFLVGLAGLTCDLSAESLFIGWLPDHLEGVQRAGSLLTGGAANGLYTIAGTILTLQTRNLRGWLLGWTWCVWAAGYALTGATLAGSAPAIAVFAGALMVLLCPWAAMMGRFLR